MPNSQISQEICNVRQEKVMRKVKCIIHIINTKLYLILIAISLTQVPKIHRTKEIITMGIENAKAYAIFARRLAIVLQDAISNMWSQTIMDITMEVHLDLIEEIFTQKHHHHKINHTS